MSIRIDVGDLLAQFLDNLLAKKQAEKLKSREMKEIWMKNDEWRMNEGWMMIKDEWRMIEGWMMKDEGWMMKDEGFKLLRGFASWQTDRQTDRQTNGHLWM